MKLQKALAATALLFAIGLPLQAGASEGELRLSLAEAVRMAEEKNHGVKAARSRLDAAEGRVVSSRKSYLPTVTLSEQAVATNDPGAVLVYKLQQTVADPATDFVKDNLNGPDPIADFNTSLQVTQPLFNADGAAARNAARAARNAAGHLADRAEESVGLEVSKAYYGMLLASRNIETLRHSIRMMEAYSGEAGKASRAGMLPESDRLSTEVRLAELREQQMVLRDEEANAEDALRVMLDVEPGVRIVPTGELRAREGAADVALAGSLDGRADLLALEEMRSAAAETRRMVGGEALPRLNAFARADYHTEEFDEDGSSWMVGLNLQWSLFDGMSRAGRLQESRAREREAASLYEEARLMSRAELARAERKLGTSRERIAVASRSLEGARASLDYIGKQYRSGMAQTFELLMREAAWTHAGMRLNQAHFDHAVAAAELDYFRGR